MDVFVMPDVLEVLKTGGFDINDLECGSKGIDQAYGIVVGPVRRAEARHGYRKHIAGRAAEALHGTYSDKQCESGIESAGYPDDGLLGADVADPLHQAGDLNGEDLPAAFVTLLRIAGYERIDTYGAVQLPFTVLCGRIGVQHFAVIASSLAGTERTHYRTGILQPRHINIGSDHPALMGEPLRFGQSLSVLGDQ
ncbi:hypothetical protein D3C80_1195910 [compost metagenome]